MMSAGNYGSIININKISKSFTSNKNDSLSVLDEVSFTIPKGSVVSLVGPNGCGKTTILNILARILEPDSGTIDNTDNNGHRKSFDSMKVSYIMQDSAESLFPWKSAWDNISFPLELQNRSRTERKLRAQQLIDELRLRDILPDLKQYPFQLSGGQKQACNIARAIMNEPDFLLMDEAFAGLDYETRLSMDEKFLEIFFRKRITSVLVSHDIEQAALLSSLVVVLSRKPTHVIRVVQIPFEHPRNHELLKSPEFFEIKNTILDFFRRGNSNDEE